MKTIYRKYLSDCSNSMISKFRVSCLITVALSRQEITHTGAREHMHVVSVQKQSYDSFYSKNLVGNW
jgi:hypothetical protein